MRRIAVCLILAILCTPLSAQFVGHGRAGSARAYRIWKHRMFVAAYNDLVRSLNNFADAYSPGSRDPVFRKRTQEVRKAWKKLGDVEPWFQSTKSEKESSNRESPDMSSSFVAGEGVQGAGAVLNAYRELITALESFMVSYSRLKARTLPADKAASVRVAWLNLAAAEPAFSSKR